MELIGGSTPSPCLLNRSRGEVDEVIEKVRLRRFTDRDGGIWSYGEGTRYPLGDYEYGGHVSPAKTSLGQMLYAVDAALTWEVDPDLEIDVGL